MLDTADDVARFWAPPPPTGDGDDDWSRGMQRAPVVIVPLSSKEPTSTGTPRPTRAGPTATSRRWPVPYWDIDTGMAALLMLLTSTDEGLGACFFGIPPDRTDAFREAFGVPPTYTPIGAITLGHPAPDRQVALAAAADGVRSTRSRTAAGGDARVTAVAPFSQRL